MALTTPGGHGLGLRLDVPRDNRLWAWPVAPLTAPPPSPIDLRGGFPFGPQDQGQEGCHDAETEVLTDRGFKLFSALDGSERLATVDPETAQLDFEVPTRLFRFPYKGPLYCAANQSLNFRVTPQHKMLVRPWSEAKRTLRPAYEFVEAQHVGWYVGLLNRVQWAGEAQSETYTLPGVADHFTDRRAPRDVPMEAWLRFLGIYLAEGTLLKRNERKGRVGYKIQLAASKEREKAVIRETLAALGLQALELRDRFTFSNRQVYEALAALGLESVKAGQKFVPAFVFRQTAAMIEAFLAGHFAGDGGMAGTVRNHWTSSVQLAADLQALIFMAGNETRMAVRAGRSSMTADGRTITGTLPEHRVSVCERKNLSIERRESLFTEEYDGEVFCAEVPTYHTLVTRREGKILISGNSCTAFAGCGALEWLLAAGDTPGADVKLSEAFTYYVNRREDGSATSQDVGASSQSIAKGMAQFGAADAQLMPYRAGDWDSAPSQSAYQDALGRRLVRYYQVSGDLLGGVWAALAGGIVLCMGFQVPTSFETGVGANGKVPQPGGSDRILGGHELVICGWFPDSTAPGGQGWVLCRNSWGTGMGLGGYYLLPTIYWQMGLVMDHMVLAFDNPPDPTPVPPPPTPEPPVDIQELDDKLAEAQNQLGNPPDGLRYQRPSASATKATWIAWSDQVREKAGIAWDYMQQVRNDLPKVNPPAPPGAEFVSPIPNGAVYGQTKWLAGSLGCDLFVPRGTPVCAPADCVIEEVLGGAGISGGDELILSLPDKSWAWRYRHTAATHAVGYRAKQGEQVGTVGDSSLDQLGTPPAWSQPMPDKFQHLDLSVNRGTDQFSPQGGGGGNVSAYQWMTDLGYQGRVLSRTPGPPDAGVGLAEAIRMMTPEGRR